MDDKGEPGYHRRDGRVEEDQQAAAPPRDEPPVWEDNQREEVGQRSQGVERVVDERLEAGRRYHFVHSVSLQVEHGRGADKTDC